MKRKLSGSQRPWLPKPALGLVPDEIVPENPGFVRFTLAGLSA